MNKYIKITTTENTASLIRKDLIAAIEAVASTSRSPGYTKLYIPGFEIRTPMSLEEVIKLIEGQD